MNHKNQNLKSYVVKRRNQKMVWHQSQQADSWRKGQSSCEPQLLLHPSLLQLMEQQQWSHRGPRLSPIEPKRKQDVIEIWMQYFASKNMLGFGWNCICRRHLRKSVISTIFCDRCFCKCLGISTISSITKTFPEMTNSAIPCDIYASSTSLNHYFLVFYYNNIKKKIQIFF